MNEFLFFVIYVTGVILISIIFSSIYDSFHKKRIEHIVHDLKFYLRYFGFDNNTYFFTYNDTEFKIAVEYKENVTDYYATTYVWINDEEALTIYSLEHTWLKSRRVDFNTKRHETEIKKIIKIARKNLKKRYTNEFHNRYDNYTYFRNSKGKDIDN